MYRNYLRVAYRNMKRHKLYSLLNIAGLSVAISCCLLITIYVRDESSYDRHHEDYRNLYRVVTDFKLAHRDWHFAWGPVKLAEFAKSSVPGVEETGLIRGRFTTSVDLKGKKRVVENATYASSGFFEVMKIPFLYGNPVGVLDDVGSIVLSKAMAQRLFNTENAIDSVINWNEESFKVTGIIEDMPKTSHLQLDMMISNQYRLTMGAENWMSFGVHTYVRLKEGVNLESANANLNRAVSQFMVSLIEENLKIQADQIQTDGNHARFYLQPVKDIHLRTDFSDTEWEHGNISTVYTISLIGLIILIVASVNFINLSTARASVRGKEVGVRKVLGSRKTQLIEQFLTESVLNCLLAFVLALFIVSLSFPYFASITGKEILDPLGGTVPLWLMALIATLILGVIAGFYPAFILSSFKPYKTLKGQNMLKMRGVWLRNILVILQFSASLVLIISAMVFTKQLNFVLDKPLGFAMDELMTLQIMYREPYLAGQEAFENELLKNPAIRSVCQTSFRPIDGLKRARAADYIDKSGHIQTLDIQSWPVSYEYITTMGLELKSGRGFSEEFGTDSLAVVINETAAAQMDFEEPIGQKINVSDREYTVIGVMKDFHQASLRNSINPMVLQLVEFFQWEVSIRFVGDPDPDIVKKAWDLYSGGQPFVYDLPKDQYAALYESDERVKLLIKAFSALTIIVAAMGLFGLAAFLAEQMRMELGIRKVLGARVGQLMWILLGSFGKLILISCLIALPVAYTITNNWLAEFAYRIKQDPMTFLLSCLIILATAATAVIYQSVKAALVNPVENLRAE